MLYHHRNFLLMSVCLCMFLLTGKMPAFCLSFWATLYGCVRFFFFPLQIIMSCVKNVLKNSRAITYQNQFLHNGLDNKKAAQWVFLFGLVCFHSSSCVESEVRGRDFETKVGNIPGQCHMHAHIYTCTHAHTHICTHASPFAFVQKHIKITASWNRCLSSAHKINLVLSNTSINM